ncbi:MAG: lipopolysaccharide heptosyltransferase II [Rhizobacter sp.]
MKSLVIAPQWIGDAVMSEPLVRALAARGEAVTVAALPWVAPVYHAMPSVAEVIELPFAHGRLDWSARRKFGRQFRGRFDTAYVLPNSLKAALVPFFAGIPKRVGYHGEGRYILLNRRRPNPGGRPPMVAFYRALAGESAVEEQPHLSFSAERLLEAADRAGVVPNAYWVFAPGAEYGPAKIWPPAHYAELARSLYAQHGQPVVLLGSGKEAALCEEISAAAPGACRVLAGKTSLIDAMALIAGARGVVSNDSGLMHVAAAFRIPQVAVFGSTSPEHTPPLSPRARVLWLKDELQLDCMPCFERTCRFGHYRCLTGVSAARVHTSLDDALQGG